KRDGRIVKFRKEKISNAIFKAMIATGRPDQELAEKLASTVVSKVSERFERTIPTVEDVQDIVEETLMESGEPKTAKAYILYRQKRATIRATKGFIGVPKDELKLGVNAIQVLRSRYLLRDESGRISETPRQMFMRVAKAVGKVDEKYGGKKDAKRSTREFFGLMTRLYFLPNSPTLMNAGTDLGQLSACFVLPVGDSMEEIFDAVRHMALIHKSGGGTGFSFSNLRPQGDVVKSTKGVASGPISFMRVFDVATEVIKQGGKRRGANMGILAVDHPDIMSFITAKSRGDTLTNFNISVAATDSFMGSVGENAEYSLINPRTGKPVREVSAREIFNMIATSAWATGDPGLVFIDEINRHNPIPKLGRIECTNPCGEQPLLPYESCNLGSINLSKMVEKSEIEWGRLKLVTREAVHFLDNVIDTNKFPLKETEIITKANRKIGLGVMGFADTLLKLGIPYDSSEALNTAEEIMKFISKEARQKSAELGEERGSFPNFKKSIWYEEEGYQHMRNATHTTIAPTGTISIIAGTSSGIEPLFAISFVRNVLNGTQLLETNSVFEEFAKREGIYSGELTMEIAKKGTLVGMDSIPDTMKQLFVTALDISPEWHVRMQAAFQKYVDNAVSKTVNLPHNATTEDIRRVFMLAYREKCKGITIYRYGSKSEQVLVIGEDKDRMTRRPNYVVASSEYSGGCPTGNCHF
ncbi:MAG: vitamin B12-dependent ribonucleotide reductase, partial [Candidatus Bathyarchaeota archaeon]